MQHISDSTLLEAYTKAINLNLDADFIRLLEHEIECRGLVFV